MNACSIIKYAHKYVPGTLRNSITGYEVSLPSQIGYLAAETEVKHSEQGLSGLNWTCIK